MCPQDPYDFGKENRDVPPEKKELIATFQANQILAENRARISGNDKEIDIRKTQYGKMEDQVGSEQKLQSLTPTSAWLQLITLLSLYIPAAIATTGVSGGMAYWSFLPSMTSVPLAALAGGGAAISTAVLMHFGLKTLRERLSLKGARTFVLIIVTFATAISIVGGIELSKTRGLVINAQNLMEENRGSGLSSDFNEKLEKIRKAIQKTTLRALACLFLALEIASALCLNAATSTLQRAWPLVRLAKKRDSFLETILKLERENSRLRNTSPDQIKLEILKGMTEGDKGRKDTLLAILLAAMLIGIIGYFLFSGDEAFGGTGPQPRHLIVGLDVTMGDQELRARNNEAVLNILGSLKQQDKITVIAITDKSFEKPLIIAKGSIPEDTSYWKAKARKAQIALLNQFNSSVERLPKQCPSTSLFGALYLAANLFQTGNPEASKTLYLLSDMRQAKAGFNFTKPMIKPKALLKRAQSAGLIVDLSGIEIHCAGVSTTGLSPQAWQTLKNWWQEYFALSQGTLKTYAIDHPEIR